MKNISDLKICVLGGRNFGKTSLLSSLILISGDKSSGITVSGDNLKKLNIYNDYKRNNGKLIATNWDDICKFRYNLIGNGNQKYKLTFIDYPGEFFQKFFSDSQTSSRKILALFGTSPRKEQNANDTGRTFSKNEVKAARRLCNELESADAFIVLLPADITKESYKVNLQVFKTQLQAWLEKIHKNNPYLPVCLAINKWDMLDKAYSDLPQILLNKPYKDFDNMLSRECGEHYICQAISAFGKNRSAEARSEQEKDELREEWDRESEPENVMEMLLEISKEAEKSRYLYLREKYRTSKIASKIFQFILFYKYYNKGANSEKDRIFCSKSLVHSASVFTGTIISLIAIILAVIGTLITISEFHYCPVKISGTD